MDAWTCGAAAIMAFSQTLDGGQGTNRPTTPRQSKSILGVCRLLGERTAGFVFPAVLTIEDPRRRT